MDYVLPLALTRRTLTCRKHDGFNAASFCARKPIREVEVAIQGVDCREPKAKNCALKTDS